MKQDPAAPHPARGADGGSAEAGAHAAITASRGEPAPRKPTPVIEKLSRVVESPRVHSWALTGLLVIAVLGALHAARIMMLPIVMAVILALVFAPLVRGLRKLGLPESLGAGLVVAGLIGAVIAGGYTLIDPAASWLNKAPQDIARIGVKLHDISARVRGVNQATAQVRQMTDDITASGPPGKHPQEVTVKAPAAADTLFSLVGPFALGALSTLVLLYFLLASGDLFLITLISATPRLADKQRAAEMAHQIETEISTYLLTVTLVNAALGAAVALAMAALGVPDPLLWGVMVGLFNFIPFLGDIASFAVLTVVGLLTFDDLWQCMLVPGIFALLTAVEGYLVTPLIVGRRLSLNPAVIVLSVLFWGWMWGIVGGLLAVPILVVLKTFYERLKPPPDALAPGALADARA